MRAMVLETPGSALRQVELPLPEYGANDILLKVRACGVCRTDLHIVDGELPEPKLPLIPGHEIVGTVAAKGEQVERFAIGQRLGVPWLGHTCGHCRYCMSGRENLCDDARFTGYTLNGGYAEYAVADAIVGYVTRDRGITIHRKDCAFMLRLTESRRDRKLTAQWGE